MLCKFHFFKKKLPFPPTPFSFVTECFCSSPPWSSLSRLSASVPVPDQTHLRDPNTVHLFCANALKVSAKRAFLPEGKQLHAHLIKFGFCQVLSLQNQILSVYLRCKEIEDAEKLFEELPGRNVVSWNIMIRGIVGCDNGNDSNPPQLCFSYFKRMLLEMVVPDDITFNGVIGLCVQFHDIGMGIQLHCFTVKVGFDLDCFVGCALVDLYAKCGLVESARKVFYVASCRDLVMWNVMISCYALNCLPEEAFGMFNLMRLDGANGDEFTFSSLLSICDTLEYYDFGKQVHSLVLRQSFDSDVLVASALINMYAKNENIIDARRVFDNVVIRNIVAWNTMIVGCGNHGDGNEVTKLLREMLREGIFPDELTISSIVSSCGYASAITETLQAHAFAVKLSFQDFLSVANSLISAYSKCGSITSAFKCFRLTSQPDLVTWTSLIYAYAFHGLAKEATEMFEKMLSLGIIPDRISFLGVLSACSHCGLVTTGLHYFKLMTSVYQIVPDSEHYTCLVDLLGRYGLINEAFEFLRSMPVEAESDTLGAFIGSCKLHANMGLAEWAAEKLFIMEPEKSANYAVMSNIYASQRHWCDVERVREMNVDKRDAKVPGCRWIEIGNQVHSFVSNDKTHQHPKALEMYATLNMLLRPMKEQNGMDL